MKSHWEVSQNLGYPQIVHFNRNVHHKNHAAIGVAAHFWKPPDGSWTTPCLQTDHHPAPVAPVARGVEDQAPFPGSIHLV